MDEIVEKIRTRIASVDPNGPRKVTGVFQLNIRSDDGSSRAITLDLNKLEVLDGNVSDAPDVSVDVDGAALVQVATNEISFEDAVATGKATITGDAELAKLLGDVVSSKPLE
ncbi:uncharacterized protein LOC129569039 [Sitodiplosis mosellana]|uniref:uncharacterized protein LOC129569039 n=1 Tax=Sitodiplosis mosellana TaxID=263140 RepID=UPI002443B501|nr:uncharacterized protein LOC129569039 [Sitodiplosis mosellana]